jgi:hypothetical protein
MFHSKEVLEFPAFRLSTKLAVSIGNPGSIATIDSPPVQKQRPTGGSRSFTVRKKDL